MIVFAHYAYCCKNNFVEILLLLFTVTLDLSDYYITNSAR